MEFFTPNHNNSTWNEISSLAERLITDEFSEEINSYFFKEGERVVVKEKERESGETDLVDRIISRNYCV